MNLTKNAAATSITAPAGWGRALVIILAGGGITRREALRALRAARDGGLGTVAGRRCGWTAVRAGEAGGDAEFLLEREDFPFYY
jgi:hypothetical protein